MQILTDYLNGIYNPEMPMQSHRAGLNGPVTRVRMTMMVFKYVFIIDIFTDPRYKDVDPFGI